MLLKCRCGNSRRFVVLNLIQDYHPMVAESGGNVRPAMVKCASCNLVYENDGYGWQTSGVIEDSYRA